MKQFLMMITFSVISQSNLFSQCAVKEMKSEEDNSIVHLAEFEKVYINEDLENGAIRVDFSFAVKKFTNSTGSPKYYLQINVTNTSGQKGFVPRQLSANKSLKLNASVKIPTQYLSGVTIESCVFDLSETEMRFFMNSATFDLEVYDNIKDVGLWIKANNKLINNQASCILRRAE